MLIKAVVVTNRVAFSTTADLSACAGMCSGLVSNFHENISGDYCFLEELNKKDMKDIVMGRIR